MMKNERGFTIMELLVVIVIIGVLAAIGVPAYQNYTTRAREAACAANRRTVQTAVGMYLADHDGYPANLTAATLQDESSRPYIDNIETMTKCPAKATDKYTLENVGTVDAPVMVVHCPTHGH